MVGPIELAIKQRRLESEKKKRVAVAAASAEGQQPQKKQKNACKPLPPTSSQEDEDKPPSYFEAVQAMPGQHRLESPPAISEDTHEMPEKQVPVTSFPDTQRKTPSATNPAAPRAIPPSLPAEDDNPEKGETTQNEREAPRLDKTAATSHEPSAPFHGDRQRRSPPSGLNAVDEVIWEAQNLLQSAAEAQALGRLRSANSFLLLAHQRMIGLGRRVDRSYCECDDDGSEEQNGDPGEKADAGTQLADKPANPEKKKKKRRILPPLISQPPLPSHVSDASNDLAYVEHLARSSMELHSKRTGRQLAREVETGRKATQEKIKMLEREHSQGGALGVVDSGGSEEQNDSGSGRGRGRKPQALVMHTVVGQNQDVRELMDGTLS